MFNCRKESRQTKQNHDFALKFFFGKISKYVAGFLLQICGVQTLATGHHPQEELTNFGFRPERKVKNFKNPPLSWRPVRTHCLNMVISEFFPQNLATLAHCSSPTNPLYRVALDFFWSPLCEISRKNKNRSPIFPFVSVEIMP